jgi:hypothetical protein
MGWIRMSTAHALYHCEEPTGPAFGRPDDKLRDEAIQYPQLMRWMAARSPSLGVHSRDPWLATTISNQKRKFHMAKSVTEMRADFQHLRRWRKSVEQAQSYTFKAVITIIVTGLVGAVWLGVRVMLGK